MTTYLLTYVEEGGTGTRFQSGLSGSSSSTRTLESGPTPDLGGESSTPQTAEGLDYKILKVSPRGFFTKWYRSFRV